MDSRVDLSIRVVSEAPAALFRHKSKMVQNKMFERTIRLPDECKICIVSTSARKKSDQGKSLLSFVKVHASG